MSGQRTQRKRAVGYIRVSTREQAQEGVSLAAQRERIEAYATYNGLELAEVFIDAGVSAGTPLAERSAGQAMLDEIARDGIECVIAFKLDRLFRDAVECLETVRQWRQQGTALRLLDLGGQEVDTKTALGQFFLTVIAAAAEMEKNVIKERTKAALNHKARQGEWRGRVPFGFRVNPKTKKLEEDPDKMRMIRAMKRSRRRSGTSYPELAKRYGLSIGTVHKLCNTDLRTLRRDALQSSTDKEAGN